MILMMNIRTGGILILLITKYFVHNADIDSGSDCKHIKFTEDYICNIMIGVRGCPIPDFRKYFAELSQFSVFS